MSPDKLAHCCLNMINQEIREWDQLIQKAYDIIENPSYSETVSAWSKDRHLISDNKFLEKEVLEEGIQYFELLLSAAYDYIEVLTRMLDKEKLNSTPALSLVRGAMEAIVNAQWLIDVSVSPEMRVARFLSLSPSAVQGSIDNLNHYASPKIQKIYDEKISERTALVKYYEKNNVSFVYSKNKQKEQTDNIASIIFEEQKAPLYNRITELVQKYLPDKPSLYPLLSGASHSKIWFLNGLEIDEVNKLDELQRSDKEYTHAIVSIVLNLLSLSLSFMVSICKYFQIDDEKQLTNKNARRQKAIWYQSGLYDEMIKLGFVS